MKHLLAALLSALLLFMTGCSYKHAPDYVEQKTVLKPASSSFYQLGLVDVERMAPLSGFYSLGSNFDALIARMYLMQHAKKSIDLQYYMIHLDLTGKIIYKLALDAADRGVKVRIILDDIDLSHKDELLATLDMHENIEIRVFNPTYFRGLFKMLEFGFRSGSVGRRMHNKAFIVDNSAMIIGGRNIADNYFGIDHKKVFIDNDVMGIGPVATQVTYQFDTYWNSDNVYGYSTITKLKEKKLNKIREHLDDFKISLKDNPYMATFNDMNFTRELRNKNLKLRFAEANIHYDAPEKISTYLYDKRTHLSQELIPYMLETKESLKIINPYFVPNEKMMDFFQILLDKGVKIEILTNSLPSADAPFVYAFYKRYQKRLVEMGVDLYEVKSNAFEKKMYTHKVNGLIEDFLDVQLHAKTMLIDDKILMVGSMNLDPRSTYHNTEVVAVINNEIFAKEVAEELFTQAFDKKNAFKLSIEDTPAYEDPDSGKEITDETRLVWISEDNGKITKFYKDAGASFMKRLEMNIVYMFPVGSMI